MYKDCFVSVIIAAAGLSRRMGGQDKLYMNLGGESVLARTARVFECSESIDEIVIVCHEDEVDRCMRQIVIPYKLSKVKAVLPGGAERYDSVRTALGIVDGQADIILVHDGARPFVSSKLVERVIEKAAQHGAAVPALPVKDTIKFVCKAAPTVRVLEKKQAGDCESEGITSEKQELKEGTTEFVVKETLERARLRAVQTPQGFDAELLRKAYEQLVINPDKFAHITDDASLIEAIGKEVFIVEGEENNFKITTPADADFANYLETEKSAVARENIQRIGMGYDVHALIEGRKLILGGVDIPYEKGLSGHSDADVLTHAVMDALMGAAGLGDIGRHFPDSDEQYRGISSLKLLKETAVLLRDAGFVVGNIDVTVVAQKPKIAPFIAKMIENIAAVLKISTAQINIKGTTTEGLGFAGRSEGIAAYASALIFRVE